LVKVTFFLGINEHYCSVYSLEGDVNHKSIKQKKKKQTKTQVKLNHHYYFIYGFLLSSVAVTHANTSYVLIYTLVCGKMYKTFIKSMETEKKQRLFAHIHLAFC